MFMRIRPMERNLPNSASDFLYHTHFYFNLLSLAAKISARWLHCHKHRTRRTCYSIVSCSPLILIGAHFSSLAINQLDVLSLFKNMMKKQRVQRSLLSRIRTQMSHTYNYLLLSNVEENIKFCYAFVACDLKLIFEIIVWFSLFR